MATTPSIPKKKPHEIFDKLYEKFPSNVSQANPRHLTPYRIKYDNWYKTIPYAFRIVNLTTPPFAGLLPNNLPLIEQNNPLIYCFFPVNPESVTISTPFATIVTPTIGSIVQEHSGAVFYNITINGTTGVLPNINISNGKPADPASESRPLGYVKPGGLIGGLLGSGFASNTINAVSSIVSAITGDSQKFVDGQRHETSGYTAFHVLYKFLWLYHFGKSKGVKQQLRFMNYKDNNMYDCVVTNFGLTRDKSRPHLYQYSISLKAWRLKTVDGPVPASDPNRLANLGLDETPSLKASLFRVITETKTALNAAANLLNTAAQDLVV